MTKVHMKKNYCIPCKNKGHMGIVNCPCPYKCHDKDQGAQGTIGTHTFSHSSITNLGESSSKVVGKKEEIL